MPERTWEIVNEQAGIIMLHLVKEKALTDAENQEAIREMCEKYPRAKLVLTHAGRGFHAPNTLKGLPALNGFENVWFDVSAVCEATTIRAILERFGPRKLLWGSDFPVAINRGKCVTVGDGFFWIVKDSVNWDDLSWDFPFKLVNL